MTNETEEPEEMISQKELKAEEIRTYTRVMLKKHVPLKVQGYRCETDMIIDVLLKAGAGNSSLVAAVPIWKRWRIVTLCVSI